MATPVELCIFFLIVVKGGGGINAKFLQVVLCLHFFMVAYIMLSSDKTKPNLLIFSKFFKKTYLEIFRSGIFLVLYENNEFFYGFATN